MKGYSMLMTAAALAASTWVVRADDYHTANAMPPMPVAQRLMKIDLDVAVRHYEKLQDALRNSRLEMLVDAGSQDASDAVQERMQRKIEILSKLTEETRQEVLQLGQELEKQEAMARVTASVRATQGTGMIPGFPAEAPAGIARPAMYGPRTVEPGLAPVPGVPGAMNVIPGAAAGWVPGSQAIPGQPAGAVSGQQLAGAAPVPMISLTVPPIAPPMVLRPGQPPKVEPPAVAVPPPVPVPPVAEPAPPAPPTPEPAPAR